MANGEEDYGAGNTLLSGTGVTAGEPSSERSEPPKADVGRPEEYEDSIVVRGQATGDDARATGLSGLIADAVSRSLWPLMLGLDYATLEVFHAVGPSYDMARWGSEVFRPSPRQVDVLLVPGVVTRKMAPVILGLHAAMAEPRFVVAVGSGAISGSPFAGSYSVVTNLHELLPVDVFIPGDPPRPEAVIAGLNQLGELVRSGRNAVPGTMPRYDAKRWPKLWTAMVDAGLEEARE